MTPNQLSQLAQKPITERQAKQIVAAVVTFYSVVHDELATPHGTIELPVPPKAPNFFQFAKWPAFFKALKSYIAIWKRIGTAATNFISEVAEILQQAPPKVK